MLWPALTYISLFSIFINLFYLFTFFIFVFSSLSFFKCIHRSFPFVILFCSVCVAPTSFALFFPLHCFSLYIFYIFFPFNSDLFQSSSLPFCSINSFCCILFIFFYLFFSCLSFLIFPYTRLGLSCRCGAEDPGKWSLTEARSSSLPSFFFLTMW